jgi:hypothetical protein
MQNFYKVDLVSLQVVNVSNLNEINKKYLKYLMGIDRSRARMHGILRLSILDF